jgi:hypothetical protein
VVPLGKFANMYDRVYETLVQSGVAEKLDHDVWRDIENNIVNTEAEAEAYGRQTGYSLVHPDKLVFFDEVGEKILQKGDKSSWLERTCVPKSAIHSKIITSPSWASHQRMCGQLCAQ